MCRVQKERSCGSVVIVVTRIKQLFGGFSFGQSLIYTVILKCFSFCVRRAKKFEVSKW